MLYAGNHPYKHHDMNRTHFHAYFVNNKIETAFFLIYSRRPRPRLLQVADGADFSHERPVDAVHPPVNPDVRPTHDYVRCHLREKKGCRERKRSWSPIDRNLHRMRDCRSHTVLCLAVRTALVELFLDAKQNVCAKR